MSAGTSRGLLVTGVVDQFRSMHPSLFAPRPFLFALKRATMFAPCSLTASGAIFRCPVQIVSLATKYSENRAASFSRPNALSTPHRDRRLVAGCSREKTGGVRWISGGFFTLRLFEKYRMPPRIARPAKTSMRCGGVKDQADVQADQATTQKSFFVVTATTQRVVTALPTTQRVSLRQILPDRTTNSF